MRNSLIELLAEEVIISSVFVPVRVGAPTKIFRV